MVGGPNDSIVFVTLGPGVCFGEIALLGTGGMNRRTASIRAHGFNNHANKIETKNYKGN